LRGPRGAQFEFTLAAIAQNLRRLAKLAVIKANAANAPIIIFIALSSFETWYRRKLTFDPTGKSDLATR
jgi:hypothetical protein